jgi:hypothetical protein
MDRPDLDLDEVFLGAMEAVVRAAPERIGDDPDARFEFFWRWLRRRLAARTCRSRLHPPTS